MKLAVIATIFLHLLDAFVFALVVLLVVIVLLAGLELLLLFIAVILLILLLAFFSILDFVLGTVFVVIARSGSFDVLLFFAVIVLLISAFNFTLFHAFSLNFFLAFLAFRSNLSRDTLNVTLVSIAALNDGSVEGIGGLMVLDFTKLQFLPITELLDLVLVFHDGLHAVEFVVLKELSAFLLTINEFRPVLVHFLRGSLSLCLNSLSDVT